MDSLGGTGVWGHYLIIKIKPESSNTNFDIKKPEEDYDKLRLDKISVVKRENARVIFNISADKIIHRKRISKLFVYQNLKEKRYICRG